jgi:hypothetical protein
MVALSPEETFSMANGAFNPDLSAGLCPGPDRGYIPYPAGQHTGKNRTWCNRKAEGRMSSPADAVKQPPIHAGIASLRSQ